MKSNLDFQNFEPTYFKVSQFHFQGNVKTDDPINLRPDVDNLESSTDEESSDDESEDKKVEKKKDGIYRLDKTKMRPMLPPDSVQSSEDRALQKAKKRAIGRFVFFFTLL